MKKKLSMLPFFVPIQRTEEHDDYTLVEGYAYVNARVPSDRYNLTRAAMEAATGDYMQFPAVREMHGASAAGTGLSAEWDQRGVKLAAKVVDPVARLKVREGVYRGFSVGVKPTIVRGNDVTACQWAETSLVDRPADADAVFTMVRIDSGDGEAEVMERASFAEYLESYSGSDLREMALDYLWNSLWDIQYGYSYSGEEMSAEDKATAIRQTCEQFAEFMVGALATGELPNVLDTDNEEQRVEVPAIVRGDFGETVGTLSVGQFVGVSRDSGQRVGQIAYIVERGGVSRNGGQEAHEAKPDDPAVMVSEWVKADGLWRAAGIAIPANASELSPFEIPSEELAADVSRAAVAETTNQISTLTIEREEAQIELARVQGEHSQAIERVATLETEVARLKAEPRRLPPVRNPQAVDRSFVSESNPDASRIKELRDELAEIVRMKPTSNEQDGQRRIGRISQIKTQLRELGFSV